MIANQRDLLEALHRGEITYAEWLKLTRLKGEEMQRALERMPIRPHPIRTRTSV